MKQLTRTQKLFISEYIKSLDPIKAVTFAGFPDDVDKAKIASEFLSKDIIIRGIKARLKRRIDSLNVPKGYVIQKAFTDCRIFFGRRRNYGQRWQLYG